jgi:hypothetical protein
MIRAKHGLLEMQSLEATVLIADGEEDLSTSCELLATTCCLYLAHQGNSPRSVFTRPSCASHFRSSTSTSVSSGADTSPFSISDSCSLFWQGSQYRRLILHSLHAFHVTRPLLCASPGIVFEARGHGRPLTNLQKNE